MKDQYDIVVIGSGPGGYIAALKAAYRGASVAVIEKDHVGGTCLNDGCIPSKALLAAGELLNRLEAGKKLGVSAGETSFDWTALQKHKDRTVRRLRSGIGNLFTARDIDYIEGTGRLDGIGAVIVEDGDGKTARIETKNVIIAAGSRPARIPGWPEDPETVCTTDEALHWDALPASLLIVGGGVIGCEFACMMQDFGVETTVVEMLPGLLPEMDEDLGAELEKIFTRRKIAVHTATKVEQLSTTPGGITAALSGGDAIAAEKVLVAVGRTPATGDLGLASAGIETDRGFIRVNDRMETGAAGVYAVGDVTGRCLLAHAASAQGVCAVENALGDVTPLDASIPYAVYTYPEVAAAGLTAAQAEERGLPVSVGRFPLGYLGKAMAVDATEGFVKVVRNSETDELLGFHMIGHNATEVVAAANAMIDQGETVTDAADIVFAHPTIGESLKEALEDSFGAALHLPPQREAE